MWLSGLELMTSDRRGFWEEGGYHDYGDPGASSASRVTEGSVSEGGASEDGVSGEPLPAARAARATPGRIWWRTATLAGARQETDSARTLAFDVPGWPGHLPGQHVIVRLRAEDGYTAQRSYSIASAPAVPGNTVPGNTAPGNTVPGNADGDRIELTVQRLADGEVLPVPHRRHRAPATR